MTTACKDIKKKLSSLFDELFTHEGYADLRVEMRILKRGQKEVILHCGKQYRYVTDFRPVSTSTRKEAAIDYPDLASTEEAK